MCGLTAAKALAKQALVVLAMAKMAMAKMAVLALVEIATLGAICAKNTIYAQNPSHIAILTATTSIATLTPTFQPMYLF